jgi:hypothetical protein
VAVSSNGAGWLVAFSRREERINPDLVASRISLSGEVLDDPPIVVSDVELISAIPFRIVPFRVDAASYSSPAIASDGTASSIVFFGSGGAGEPGEAPLGQAVLVARVDLDGRLEARIDLLADLITVGQPQGRLLTPLSAAAAEGDLFALWSSGSFSIPDGCFGAPGRPCRLFLFSNFGLMVGPNPPEEFALPTSAGAVANRGLSTFAAWGERSTSTGKDSLQGFLLTAEAEPRRTLLAPLERYANTVAVAAGDDEFLVVWREALSDATEGGSDIHGLIHRPDDSSSDAAPFFVATGANVKVLGGAAYSSGVFLVVWAEDGRLHAARVSPEGDVDAPVILASDGVVESAVAADDTGFLVVLSREADEAADIVGLFVPPVDPS